MTLLIYEIKYKKQHMELMQSDENPLKACERSMKCICHILKLELLASHFNFVLKKIEPMRETATG